MNWTPIGTEPQDGTEFLAINDAGRMAIVWKLESGSSYWTSEADNEFHPTHYILIPPPPEQTESP